MADHAAANEDIWPSQNDVAQTVGNGKKLLENQWASLGAVYGVNNYSLSGLTVPGSSGTLNINVALGTAYIAGRWISIPGATSVTAAPSSTNYVFLKLVRDGSNLVTGAVFEVNTTGVAPANSTPIAILTAGASTITATTDKRILPTTIEVLSSGTLWTFPAGITRVYVEVYGASGGGGGGGEGYDSTTPAPGNDGSNGTAGGTTNFGALTANGGAAGGGGKGGGHTSAGVASAAAGTASGGAINLTGLGLPGGSPGGGGGPGTSTTPGGQPGGAGGPGGFSAGYVTGAVGSTVAYAIGAGGNPGAGGTGFGGADGAAGQPGHAGRIVIHY